MLQAGLKQALLQPPLHWVDLIGLISMMEKTWEPESISQLPETFWLL